MENNIQRYRPFRLNLLKRALLKPETVTIMVPGQPRPVQAVLYRQRPLVLGVLVLLAVGGGYWLFRPPATPVPHVVTYPVPMAAAPPPGCIPDHVWLSASHVTGRLTVSVDSQPVRILEYGRAEAIAPNGKYSSSPFNGPGFGQLDLIPILRDGKNRLQLRAEHPEGREWAGIRMTLAKNSKPIHVVDQPFERTGKRPKVLYDQTVEVDVTTCRPHTAEDIKEP